MDSVEPLTAASREKREPEAERGNDASRGRSSPSAIVGIGASAGGVEALHHLLSTLPADTGMAFVVVQHLDPHHESHLPDVLVRSTAMPVRHAEHGMLVKPNEVYVIPPNSSIAVAHGALVVTPRGDPRALHLPVDHLFRSLAESQQSRAIGIVLSGSGSDGTLGLAEIKAAGGLTFAQSEATAKHGSMPNSAIHSGCVDFVLSPEEIGARLGEVVAHPYLARDRDSEPPPNAAAEKLFERILALVRTATKVDFSQYRDTTIRRRILRRMALHTQESLPDYVQRLEQDRGEVEALYRDLLINVTSFFRDPEVFDAVKSKVLPELARSKRTGAPLRIWVPGCSTGQEAYSLAITVLEFFDDQPVRPPIQVFATDLSDPTSLDKARLGVYPESIEAEVSAERLRRFFRKEDHTYRIDKSVRDLCVFARQNVMADPPFSHLDVISCRNVLIYLSPPLQKRILPTFHHALNVPGFLVLGSSESVGEHNDLFEPVDRSSKIYAKKPAATRAFVYPTGESHLAAPPHLRPPGLPLAGLQDLQKEADRVLLGRYAPSGVLVDENLDILQFRGRTSAYLEPAAGEPTTKLLKMAREGLFVELRSALAEAKEKGQTARREGVRLRTEHGQREIVVEVLPIRAAGAEARCYLVLFQEPDRVPHAVVAPEPPRVESLAQAETEIAHLRQELSASKEYLQSLIEGQDAVNEELRSANEEILSSNEELQSTNEELETAKEELQSMNEELTTVNEQLQHRNLELNHVNNDLTNLLSSTSLPVLMVGPDLRIRRFTPAARKLMNLLPNDVGRPLTDIRSAALLAPDLEQLVLDVIEKVQPREREVRDDAGRWNDLRVYPYRTLDNKIDGAVLVLVDIDLLKRTQAELETQAELLRRHSALIELTPDAVVVSDQEGRIEFWNRGAQQVYGWSSEEAVGKPADELLASAPAATVASARQTLEKDGSWEGELLQRCKDGDTLVVHTRNVLVRDPTTGRASRLSVNRDISDRKEAEERLRTADRRKDEFLAVLGHELRNPIAPIVNAVEVLRLAGNDQRALGHVREVLERQVQQLARIVNELLDVSRVAEGKVVLQRERVALADVVQTAIETTRELVERCRHRLTVTLPSVPVYLDGDLVRLSQAFVNLLNNAAKFTPPGGRIALTAEVEKAARPGREARSGRNGNPAPGRAEDMVVIRLRDSGIGIAPEFLPRLFERFSQGGSVPEHGRGGLGIGLNLTKSLVELHGGTIEAKSDGKDKGSEFVVRLPLAADQSAPRAAPIRGEARKTGAWRILVVDDNADQTHTLGRLLQLMGHEVRTALDAESALAAAEELGPDLAIVDIGMPIVDGYELARRFRAHPRLRDVVLVAQTGWGSEEDRERSRRAGFDHHLVKPVMPAELQRLITAGKPRSK